MSVLRTYRCDGCRRVTRGEKPCEWFALVIERVCGPKRALWLDSGDEHRVTLDACSEECLALALRDADVLQKVIALEVTA